MTTSRSSAGSTLTPPTRILIADRNRMGNQLLSESLGHDPRFEIVADANGADLLPIVAARHPHLALISAELNSGAKKGLQIARKLNGCCPDIHIVILLEEGTRESVIAAFRCGAAGVFCRTDPLLELPACIERVSRGQIWASRNCVRFLLETLRSAPSCEGITAAKIELLTARELQVAEHAAQGQSNKQIADRLGLSEHTVKNYLFHVFEKLEVSNRMELLLLFKGSGQGRSPGGLSLGNDASQPIGAYLKAAEEGVVAAQFIAGLAHLEGHGTEKNERSA